VRDHQEEWLELCRQASVEQDGEKLFQLVRRINDLLDAKDRRLQESTPVPASRNNRVFQIAYDDALLIARAELLKERGYEVSSVLTKRLSAFSTTAKAFVSSSLGMPHRERQEKRCSAG
jgi:hypothetical protein